MKKLLIGLTGIIGCGKTTVSRMLEEFGVPVIYVDRAGRWAIEENDSVRSRIRERFGQEVFISDKLLDRGKMASIVFSDKKALSVFNAIVHPVMIKHVEEQIQQLLNSRHSVPYLVVDAALIFELALDEMLDYVVTVSAPLEDCIKRTHLRDRLSRRDILARMRSQLSAAEKEQKADYVLVNDRTLTDLQEKVNSLHQWLLERAAQR
jgi:dephospho-CoA kinase